MTAESISSKQLSMLIAEEVFSGHGFVPFVGSGMSAPSGILMGVEFDNFLAYSIYRVVGKKPRHDLPRDGWPKFPRDEEVSQTRAWVMEKFTQLCRQYACEPMIDEQKRVRTVKYNLAGDATSHHLWSTHRPLIPTLIRSHDDETWENEKQTQRFQEQFRKNLEWGEGAETGAFSRTSDGFIIESGLRSMHDWRSMLQFLAKIHFEDDERLTIKQQVDTSVIDSFNVHITRDRQINLGQKMLAHLSGPLRIRTVLTTNFDNLIETAFQKLLRPLNVVSVSSRGELPDPVTVRSKDTIVKLHGELSETRADFSLDDEPKEHEKETFARYVRGEFDTSKQTDPTPNHILVMGFSGQDVRIIQMMKYTLDTRPNVKIFWICHGTHEPKRLRRIFGKEYESRVLVHQTERPDLFLYELYQNVTLTLPSGGFSYEFTHKVPPEKVRNDKDREFLAEQRLKTGRTNLNSGGYGVPVNLNDRKLLRNKIAKSVGTRIFSNIHERDEGPLRSKERLPSKGPIAEIDSVQITNMRTSSPKTLSKMKLYFTSGCASAMRVAFRKLLSKRYHCLWLELQDYPTPEGLIQDVLRVLALRVGSYQLEHVILFPEAGVDLLAHLKRLLKFLGISSGKWVLFFYGRSIAGAASSWQNTPWTKEQLDKFEVLLDVLCKAGFHCVYSPITRSRIEKERLKTKVTSCKLYPNSKKQIPHFKEAFQVALNHRGAVTSTQDDKIGSQLGQDSTPVLSNASHLDIFDSLQRLLTENWIKPKPLEFKGDISPDEKLTSAREAVTWYYRKMRFLYASTLFRQSRHTSAFFSDAVFPCPNKFNLNGIDNDWVRSIEVNQWVGQLGSIDVFFYKPGGYSWKYRDMRLGLQNEIEAIPFANLNETIFKQIYSNATTDETEIKEEMERVSPLSYALQIRSRSHFEIAKWYWRAFNATGHYLPFIETLYHYFECLDNIDFARPISLPFEKIANNAKNQDTIWGYQITLARDSMLSMIKCLKTGKPWVKFWLTGVRGHEMFEFTQLEKWFENKLKNLVERPKNQKIRNWNNELKMAKTMLRVELAAVQSSLQSEAGNYVPIPHSGITMPDSRFDQFSRKYERTNKLQQPELFDLGISSDSQVWKDEFDLGFTSWLNHRLLHLNHKRGAKFPLDQISQAIKGTTDDDPSETAAVGLKIRRLRAAWVKDNLHRAKPFSAGQKKQEWGFDNSAAIFLVELISDYAYLLVKRAKMEAACSVPDEDWARKTRTRWIQATMYCSLGLNLCKHLHPAYLQRERRQQIKLQTLYGLSLAYLGRPLEANRRFNEASAILSKESRTPDEVETAIIRIRRATASLLRSELIGDVIDSLPAACFVAGIEVQDSKFAKEKKDEFKAFLKRTKDWKEDTLNPITASHILDAIEASLLMKRKLKYVIHHESSFADSAHRVNIDPILKLVLDEWRDESKEQPIKNALDDLQLNLSRMHTAMLDDAWVYIESAERLLAGYSQSSLWWGRVSALKLRAYAQVRSDAKFESLVFRRKIQHDNQVVDLQQQLLLIAPSSSYQKTRCVHLGAKAMIAIYQQDFVSNASFSTLALSSLFSTLRESIYGILKDYCSRFNETNDGEYLPEFPELLHECLKNAEASARQVAQLVYRISLKLKFLTLDDLLNQKNGVPYPSEVDQYTQYCYRGMYEGNDDNFDKVVDLMQRAELCFRIENKLESASEQSFT